MIGSLRGELLDRSAGGEELIIEVSGIGYRVLVTPSGSSKAGDVGSESFLHIHHHQREDAELLYGFANIAERRVFETLISTHGVGPSLGMSILAALSPARLRQILATDDVTALCAVPGVGKKTAARLLVELKSKLDVPELDESERVSTDAEPASSAHQEAREALLSLGYGVEEIAATLAQIDSDGDAADVTRQALRLIAGA